MSHRKSSSIERHGLTAYKYGINGIGSDRINMFLRNNFITDSGSELVSFTTHGKTVEKICSAIRNIDNRLVKNTKDIKVYRGISGDFYKSIKLTGCIVNKSYTSSTTSKDTAIAFSQGDSTGVVLVFTIPPGIRIHTYSSSDEHEILIERNTQFINFVERYDKENDILFVETVLTKYTLPIITNTKVIEKSRSNSLQNLTGSKLSDMLEKMDIEDPDFADLFK